LVDRADLQEKLESTPGKHLVLVRYGEGHSVHEEWVYNAADIDSSKVVWARDLPGDVNARLLDYYRDRAVWLVSPDSDRVSLLRPALSGSQPKLRPVQSSPR
jgi:hypothetical protein